MRAITKRFLYALLALVLCVVTVFCGQVTLSASADSTDSVQATYESTNVLNNLKGATIGGKEFDLADYPHNANGKPQVISFVEFCYSYYAEKQADYGLYVYVYNPQDVAFDMSTERNKILLTYGQKQSYSKYVLEFINYSTDAGYEGRFWKFKVRLTDGQRSDILKEVEENNRVYKISGIELSVKSNVTEYACGQTYTYKGYALGYGSELAASDIVRTRMEIDKAVEDGVRIFLFGGRSDFDDLCYDLVTEKRNAEPLLNIKRVFCFALDKQLRKPPRWFIPKEYEALECPTKDFDFWYMAIYYRNLAMIDQSDLILFWVERRENSGAYKTYRYAVKKHKRIVNLFA